MLHQAVSCGDRQRTTRRNPHRRQLRERMYYSFFLCFLFYLSPIAYPNVSPFASPRQGTALDKSRSCREKSLSDLSPFVSLLSGPFAIRPGNAAPYSYSSATPEPDSARNRRARRARLEPSSVVSPPKRARNDP